MRPSPTRGRLQNTARLLLGAWLLASVAVRAESTNPASNVVLASAAQVRALSPEQAAKRLPVHLHGVVLASPSSSGALVIQDETEAIYLIGPVGAVSKLRRGDLVEVNGVTDPGGYAPIVIIHNFKKTGTGPVPVPHRVTFDELIRKQQYDAQFVEISGIVRSCEPTENTNDLRTKMVIASGGGRLALRLHERLAANSLVDAEVRLRGICYARYTTGRQFLSPLLDIPPGEKVLVEKPAPENAWSTPLLPVADLLKFTPQRDNGHRVRVRGVVTFSDDGLVWLRDHNRGLRVQTDLAASLQPGDEVEALGFPSRGDYSPVMEDAIFKKLASSKQPLPTMITNLSEAASMDADLVQLDARLNDKRPVKDGWALTLDWQGTIVEAQVKLTNGSKPPADWLPDSGVRAAGICSVKPVPSSAALSGVWEPQSFSLLLRSPADLTVIQPAPWWTHERIMVLSGILAGISLLVTIGVVLAARRRLLEQKARRATAEAEFAAILSERNRLAREIHDTLAQGLAATSVQLRLAKKCFITNPEQLVERLDTAQTLVRESLDEARKSIWNMRSQVLETGDLAAAIESILKQLTKDTGIEARFAVAGKIRRLSPAAENNLLRAGQEAITNAIKHARPETVTVRLEFAEKFFSLTVQDDGCGFDPAHPPQSSGGFGLVGMRERAAVVHGEFTVHSTPGQGTEINFRLPLTGE